MCSFSDNDIDPTTIWSWKVRPQFSWEGWEGGGALTLCFLVDHLYLGYILGLEFTNCPWSHNIMHLNYFKVWQLFSWEVHNTTDSSMKPNLPDECVTPLLSCYLMATIRAVRKGQLSPASYSVFSVLCNAQVPGKNISETLRFSYFVSHCNEEVGIIWESFKVLGNPLCNLLDGLSKLWQHWLKDWENLNQYLYLLEDLIIHFWFSLLKNTRGDSRGNFRISWLKNVLVKCVS